MKFYTIDDDLLYTKLRYFEGIEWRQNSSYLNYKMMRNETIEEAKGHYIMYVVEQYEVFEKVCKEQNVTITELPIDEADYQLHFEIYYKGKKKLNEDLLHVFDDIEDFVKLIAVPGEKLIITDSYSYELDDTKVDSISNWLNLCSINDIEFVVPAACQRRMANIVARFNSHGINITFVTQHIHGRYWIVKDNGFFMDGSNNTSQAFLAGILTDQELRDIKLEYSL